MELFKKKTDMSKYDDYKFAFIDLEIILTQKCNINNINLFFQKS
jgi:hypothetical protein